MIGTRLRELRTIKHLTQQQVADKIGLTRPAYTAYETGKRVPDGPMTARLASIYDVTTDYILERTDNKSPIKDNETDSPDLIANHLNKDYNDLSEDERAQVDNFIKFMKNNKKK